MIAQRSISPHYNRNPKNRPVELIRGLSLWAALSAPLLPSDSNRTFHSELLCATRLVAEHRLDEDEAFVVAGDLAYQLVRRAYKF